ncbi:hypothetical protein SD77_2566 [Bacillus badius]|uniref:Uncharacterized protein n=1 Tax=Bacillus badius TaxID=1455 RepID=A0ABR5AZH5_BACBA|nr:hypothetical protein SD78_1979 [Bacillus badius]KIL80112.1 hypothetical protein SD77_2566 [Bacillus badius]
MNRLTRSQLPKRLIKVFSGRGKPDGGMIRPTYINETEVGLYA